MREIIINLHIMKNDYVTKKEFQNRATVVDARFDGIDNRLESMDGSIQGLRKAQKTIVEMIDRKFEEWQETMRKWMDKNFVVLDRAAKDIRDCREEQIASSNSVLQFGDDITKIKKRLTKLEAPTTG